MREKIEKVLRQKVAPALAQHGGGVEFVDFAEGVLKVRFLGQCASCPSAYVTLEEVVEKGVKEELSFVEKVVSVQGVSDELLDFARSLMGRRE